MDKPIDAVVADLTRETASWTTIGVKVSLKQVRHVAVGAAKPGTTTGNREEYSATSRGLRKYAQFSPIEGREMCVLLGYADGDRCASVRFQPPPNETRQRSITIAKSFLREASTGTAELPASLPFYVGLAPIRTAITRAEPIGPSRVLDRDCVRYSFANVPGDGATQDLVYHLDAATSYPLKVEAFANRDRFRADQPTTVWEVLKLDEVQGRHVATDSKFTTWIETEGGRRVPILTNFDHVDSIRFDDPTPADHFWPRYDPGVLIHDRIAGKSSKVGADGKTTALIPSTTATPTTALFAAGLIIGLVLLVVGIARRRQRGAE